MEELNKNQLILLALLVSFVTSMATGIVTVSLMEDSPDGVQQTIYRVVEKTVERVTQTEEPAETRTVVREVPVVITEEKLIIDAVDTIAPAIGRLWVAQPEGESIMGGPVFRLDISSDKVFALALNPLATSTGYEISFEGEDKREIEVFKISDDELLTAFSLSPIGQKTIPLSDKDLSIGQTVVAVTIDRLGYSVSVGVASGFTGGGGDRRTFRTNAANNNRGAILINVDGKLIGLSLGDGTALALSELTSFIDSLQ